MPDRWRRSASKRSGYASAGIKRYLLVDRAPAVASSTLYTDPDPGFGSAKTWEFGETIQLPGPFDLEIPTDEWAPWPE